MTRLLGRRALLPVVILIVAVVCPRIAAAQAVTGTLLGTSATRPGWRCPAPR